MSRIGKILSANSCAKCRVCCGFTREDIWEIPLIYAENRAAVEERLGVKLIPRGEEFVFDMEFAKQSGEEISFCPALSENGCALGELKPFDCAVWPFRVNALDDLRVITVSPVCETVYSLPLKMLSEFVQKDGFSEMLFSEAKKHPEIVKPYIDGYPILAVEK
ncbi:MAG: hypothetical protein K2J77_00450 [Oscillospiraceae bacterium]|nr:hypothetical protein [Oscillospiraceae bacterium]